MKEIKKKMEVLAREIMKIIKQHHKIHYICQLCIL
jgi:hypothetical protein